MIDLITIYHTKLGHITHIEVDLIGCFIYISSTHTFVNVVIHHTGVLVFKKKGGREVIAVIM